MISIVNDNWTNQSISEFPPDGRVGVLLTSILRKMSVMVGIIEEEGFICSCE